MSDTMKVVYLMSGPAHLPYLAVSLYSLRQHWNGEIEVFCWPESWEICDTIAQDDRLWISVHRRDPVYRGKNCQFLDKIKLADSLDCPRAMYLDADTMVKGPLDQMEELLLEHPFVATQFNKWPMHNGMPSRRIQNMLGREVIPQKAVERCLREPPLPSVNGGVFGFWPGTAMLSKWRRYTEACLDIFIGDEVALHAVVAEYVMVSGYLDLCVIEGGAYNCSPKYQPRDLPDRNVTIWHFHGDSNVRPQKTKKGLSLWWPVYQECLEKNIGGIRDWKDACNNKWIKALESESLIDEVVT